MGIHICICQTRSAVVRVSAKPPRGHLTLDSRGTGDRYHLGRDCRLATESDTGQSAAPWLRIAVLVRTGLVPAWPFVALKPMAAPNNVLVARTACLIESLVDPPGLAAVRL